MIKSSLSLAGKSALFCILLSGIAAAQTTPSVSPPSLDRTIRTWDPPTPVPKDPPAPVVPQPQVIPGQEFCTQEYVPVCGVTGDVIRTYPNRCVAEAARAKIISGGKCS